MLAASWRYLGPMEQETRDKLLNDWKTACQGDKREEASDDDENDQNFTVDDHELSEEEPAMKIPLLDIKQVPLRHNFSLKGILSTEEELYTWSRVPSESFRCILRPHSKK